ncbi:hypothetical protein, partial [Mesorhizobium sp. M4B.F.Ca.ET.019.03.1.1]|uniref:hypothetical protein n=1 Tax=Mesorhizobium sp. M4B.F.Ca.ET.019.03.1.1 TaxID=2496651 RepID=UPI001AECB83C
MASVLSLAAGTFPGFCPDVHPADGIIWWVMGALSAATGRLAQSKRTFKSMKSAIRFSRAHC